MEDKIIIPLMDENGKTINYELVDINFYNNQTYAIFYPVDSKDTELVICRVDDNPNNSEESIYTIETDEKIIKELYNQFKIKSPSNFVFIDSK